MSDSKTSFMSKWKLYLFCSFLVIAIFPLYYILKIKNLSQLQGPLQLLAILIEEFYDFLSRQMLEPYCCTLSCPIILTALSFDVFIHWLQWNDHVHKHLVTGITLPAYHRSQSWVKDTNSTVESRNIWKEWESHRNFSSAKKLLADNRICDVTALNKHVHITIIPYTWKADKSFNSVPLIMNSCCNIFFVCISL
jgi:hypothetical protein